MYKELIIRDIVKSDWDPKDCEGSCEDMTFICEV